MIWFTSDAHFNHKRIIDMAQRPFADTQEMDERIIENINARVKADDALYHLGDLALNAGGERELWLRERIGCRTIHLVHGNHDRSWNQPGLAGTLTCEPATAVIRPRERTDRSFVLILDFFDRVGPFVASTPYQWDALAQT